MKFMILAVETLVGASLPTWERGLKFCLYDPVVKFKLVAPYMGAWIEISALANFNNSQLVAPYMGAWIEIINACNCESYVASLPTWERGLKYMKYFCKMISTPSLPTWERGLK